MKDAQIIVHTINQNEFEVIVESSTTTTHHVTVSTADYEKLSDQKVVPERLVELSFRFLLERESNASILSRFELPIIGRYFPEYEETIKRMLD